MKKILSRRTILCSWLALIPIEGLSSVQRSPTINCTLIHKKIVQVEFVLILKMYQYVKMYFYSTKYIFNCCMDIVFFSFVPMKGILGYF